MRVCQGIADCTGQRRFARDTGQLGVQPELQIVEDLFGPRLPEFDTQQIWRRSACLFLNRVELRDATDGFIGAGLTLGAMDVDELTPDMGHAGHLADIAGTVEILEPGIAVSVHPALIFCEMALWVLPFAIW